MNWSNFDEYHGKSVWIRFSFISKSLKAFSCGTEQDKQIRTSEDIGTAINVDERRTGDISLQYILMN
jgi:hypothetical protein